MTDLWGDKACSVTGDKNSQTQKKTAKTQVLLSKSLIKDCDGRCVGIYLGLEQLSDLIHEH
jgi:hypothetical protein